MNKKITSKINDKKEQIYPDWKNISKVLKFKKKDFDKLLENYISSKKEIYKNIKSIQKENRTFENTILALENSANNFTDTIYQIGVYSITHKDKEYRDSANDFQKEMSEKIVDIEYDKDIYKAVKDYIEGNYKKEKNSLGAKYGAGSIKLAEDTFKEYKKMGFDLPKKDQDKLKNNLKKLSKLSIDFSKNIDEYRDFILVSEEESTGLPENYKKTLEKIKDGKEEKYKVTLDYPSFGPFMQYADSREKRKELADKNYKKGGEKNLKLLAEMIKIRDENAKILGYKNHVDFKTEDRMAKSEKNVRDFVEGLIKKLSPKSKKELEELNDFAKKNLENYKDIKTLEYFDISYVANKMKEAKYGVDSAKLKEYFPLEHVLSTMFSIFGDLFGFTAVEILDKEKRSILADEEARLYEFKDKKSKQIISYLVLDLFPREGKYGHACSSEFIVGSGTDNKRKIPINELICNFTKPTKNLPSLLSLEEVDTLFHELGHGLHFMFTNVAHGSQAGYNVAWDFVETPSQMLENFLFEEDNLKKISKNYKTNKSLDKNTVSKIIEGRNFLNGYDYTRQNIVSLYDIDLHAKGIKNLSEYYRDLLQKYQNISLPKESLFPASFGHIGGGGYSAGYYSYMWALVYADDFYSEFKKVINDKNKLKEVGERYRKEILEVGGSRDEMESVKKFLKRNPNNKAFLEKIGIR